MSAEITIHHIEKAAESLKGVIIRTPTVISPWLSKQNGPHVFLKLENLQVVSSFKARGAYIKLSQLSENQRRKGIITMSAGNHAQGVAYHAKALKIPATIIMPLTTPFAKIESTKKLGATIILEGDNLSESGDFANHLAHQKELTLIHPYDDPAVIAGQGTVALEMLEDVPDLDALLIPIGGGGLAAGMAIAAKALNPKIDIVGVQSTSCPSMAQALYPERTFPIQHLGTASLAEGIAVKSPGILTRAILKPRISDILLVSEEQIEVAIECLASQGKLTVEGAGAVGIAALLAFPERFQGRKIGIVVCGGNIDNHVLSFLLLRGLVRQGKLAHLKITINDAPGTLGKISQIIGQTGGNIFEIHHQRLFNHIAVKMAELDIVIETRDYTHKQEIIDALHSAGFPTTVIE
jgi:threonine dehydratase